MAGPRPNATAVAMTASRYSIDALARLTCPSTTPINTLTSATAPTAKTYPAPRLSHDLLTRTTPEYLTPAFNKTSTKVPGYSKTCQHALTRAPGLRRYCDVPRRGLCWRSKVTVQLMHSQVPPDSEPRYGQVLVVEDERPLRTVIARNLSSRGI